MAHQLWCIDFLTPPTPFESLTDSLPSLNLLCHSQTDAQFMQNGRKEIWSIPYISVAFFPSLKQNSIAYRSSKVSSRPVCIFEIHQLWQSGFSRVYSNSCCSCSFEPEIIKIGQSSQNMYSNKILNFQESTTILNTCTKKKRLETYWIHHVYIKYIWNGLVGVYCISTFVGYLMPNPPNIYVLNIYGLVGLWHINHCRSFNVKSSLYTCMKYIWFGLVGFYSFSNIVAY